jgi:hypothetical protein
VDGRTAVLQADVKYRAKAWYNPPVLPEISAKCGDEDEQPRAHLTVETTVQLTSGWTLRPRTRAILVPLSNPDRDRCKVTFLRFDVTGKVMDAAQDALQQKLAEFDARLAAFDLPHESRRLWNVLGSPLKLTDSLWLVINPSTLRIGMLQMQGDTLVTMVGLSANPRVIGGPRQGDACAARAAGLHSRPPGASVTEAAAPRGEQHPHQGARARSSRWRTRSSSDSLHLIGGRRAVRWPRSARPARATRWGGGVRHDHRGAVHA